MERRLSALEEALKELRKDNEHLRDLYYGGESGIGVGAVWAAFIDFRGEMREGIAQMHQKQDKTNGTLKRHEWQIAFASGGVAVIAFLVAVFGIYVIMRIG